MQKEAFINRIGRALKDVQGKTQLFYDSPSPQSDRLLKGIAARKPEDRQPLRQKLRDAAEPLNLQVTFVTDPDAAGEAITRLVLEKQPEWGDKKRVVSWHHPLLAQMGLESRLREHGIPVTVTEPEPTDEAARTRLRKEIVACFVGITSADFCLAETATLVMRTRSGRPRSVSLVPSIHVAVIAEDQLLSNLKELYALLRWDPKEQSHGLTNCMTLISGPSKTADIEATLVHGAHGPRELHLFVCG